MSYWDCDNPREHQREGRRDFERGGRYGYDSQKYNDHWDDCNKAYHDGFDEARREQDRAEERRREQEEEERAEERRRHQQRELEQQWAWEEEQRQRALYEAEQAAQEQEEPIPQDEAQP